MLEVGWCGIVKQREGRGWHGGVVVVGWTELGWVQAGMKKYRHIRCRCICISRSVVQVVQVISRSG
jgi:hypothetical protein